MTDILIPVSPGELVDRLTILRLKTERITDATKLKNVRYELGRLRITAEASLPADGPVIELGEELYRTNAMLWEVEDELRAAEAEGAFGADFVELARAVYRWNDKRADLKRQINSVLGSAIREEKSYKPY
jgi:uncharacterized protein DUF6165